MAVAKGASRYGATFTAFSSVDALSARMWGTRGNVTTLNRLVTSGLNQLAKGILRIDCASQAPFQKLGDVNPPLTDLRLVYPRLAAADAVGHVPLGHAGSLAHLPEQARHGAVAEGMLALHHTASSLRGLRPEPD